MLLFVIFDEKEIRIGVWFSCNFSGFLVIGKYIVTYGAGEKSCCQWCCFSYLWCYCLWCNIVTKSKSSCQWCTFAFVVVTQVTCSGIKTFSSGCCIYGTTLYTCWSLDVQYPFFIIKVAHLQKEFVTNDVVIKLFSFHIFVSPYIPETYNFLFRG